MQVELERVSREAHGRHFVTPLAVVALVVRVHLDGYPAGLAQPGLYVGKPVARHEEIDVRYGAAVGEAQVLDDIRGPFQQHDRGRDRFEHRLELVEVAEDQLLAIACGRRLGVEMVPHRPRNRVERACGIETLPERREQPARATHANHAIPDRRGSSSGWRRGR